MVTIRHIFVCARSSRHFGHAAIFAVHSNPDVIGAWKKFVILPYALIFKKKDKKTSWKHDRLPASDVIGYAGSQQQV